MDTKLSTKGQFNDNKLQPDDYDTNRLAVSLAIEHMQMAYDLLGDYNSGIPPEKETNKNWRRGARQSLAEAYNKTVFAVDCNLVAMSPGKPITTRGPIQGVGIKLNGIAFGDEEEDDLSIEAPY